ncbi:MAG: RsmE family RNA methyltransferase [Acidobacteriota bacterium]
MRRRFFVDEIRDGQAHLAGDDARHLTKVLRVEVGQKFEISDNRNAYLAEIEAAHKGDVSFRVVEQLPAEAPRVHMTLCAAIYKFDHFEWMVEKATELGVAEIVPVHAARTESGLEKAAEKRTERWRRIALEASQQCRRTHVPVITKVLTLGEALARPATYRYVLDENASGTTLASALPAQRSVEDSVAVLIGPEGGWTDAERGQFMSAWSPPWVPVSMGPLILRAETAAISALAVVGNAWLER